MPTRVAHIDINKGFPEVEIIIGQAQSGKYEFVLWDNTGHNPIEIGHGINTDHVLDKFPVGPIGAITKTADLIGRFLSWSVNVSAFESGPGQLYSVTIIIRQEGANVLDGPFMYQGALDGAKLVFDWAQFVNP
jgi:hypothetical protein